MCQMLDRLGFGIFGCILTLLFFHFIYVPAIKEVIPEKEYLQVDGSTREWMKNCVTCPTCDGKADVFKFNGTDYCYLCKECPCFSYFDKKGKLTYFSKVSK